MYNLPVFVKYVYVQQGVLVRHISISEVKMITIYVQHSQQREQEAVFTQ